MNNRRRFLQFLAASPLLRGQQGAATIASPAEALNVNDFEAAARAVVPPAHFGYMASGVEDDITLRANREGFHHIELRARKLVNVSVLETGQTLFGVPVPSPILLAPAGSQRAFHPEGEIAVARAAKTNHTVQILSAMATSSLADVSKALGQPAWSQLYSTNKWEVTRQLVKRAEDVGSPVLVFTIDRVAGRNSDTAERFKRLDTRNCSVCHQRASGAGYQRKPIFDGIDMKGVSLTSAAITWEFVDRLKELTRMKLVLKGIVTREDALLCLEHGVDGIIVSNHGGRSEESGRATIDSLPEVVEAVGGKIPVLIDGGFRRGTDIFKAIALGARAICVGRPYLWGLGAFGEAGVDRVLKILHSEFELIMKQCGTPTLGSISGGFLVRGR